MHPFGHESLDQPEDEPGLLGVLRVEHMANQVGGFLRPVLLEPADGQPLAGVVAGIGLERSHVRGLGIRPAREVFVSGSELGLDLRVISPMPGQHIRELVEELLVLINRCEPEGHLDRLAVVRIGLQLLQDRVERLGLARFPVFEVDDLVPLACGAALQDPLLPQRDDRDHEDDEVERGVVRLQLDEGAALRATCLDAMNSPFAAIPGATAVDQGGHRDFPPGRKGGESDGYCRRRSEGGKGCRHRLAFEPSARTLNDGGGQ